MPKLLSLSYSKWCEFWFAPRDLYVASFVRMILFTLMFFLYLERQFNIELYFFDSGFVPISQVKDVVSGYLSERVFIHFTTDTLNYYFHLLFLVVLFLMAVGVGGRKIAWVALLLHVSFQQRNIFISYGVDFYSSFWILYFCFIKSDQHFSVLNYFNKKRQKFIEIQSDALSSMGIRLIEVQIMLAYVYTGFEKLKGFSWWKGVALWEVLMNPQLNIYDWGWLKHISILVLAMTYLTIAYEIYAPVGFYNEKTRRYFIAFGVLFHLGIAFIMSLYFFGFLMASSLLIFLKQEEVKKLLSVRFSAR